MAIFGGAHLAFDSARGSSGPGAVCFFFFFRASILKVCVWCVIFVGVFSFLLYIVYVFVGRLIEWV